MKRSRHTNYHAAKETISRIFKDHVTSDRPSRTFTFRHKSGSSNYAFSLMWTPGTMTLAGDLGEMTLTHYHAIRGLEESLRWASADPHYLLEKSDKTRSLDRARTFEDIRHYVNEDAVDYLKGHREALQEWRLDKPIRRDYGRAKGWKKSYTHAVDRWQCDKPKLEFQTKRLSPRDEDYDPTKYNPSIEDILSGASLTSYQVTVPPDGWRGWHRLHKAFGHGQDTDIFSAKYRRFLLLALSNWIYESSPDQIAQFTYHDLRLDDFGYATDYTFRDYQQVLTIQWAARRALEWLEGERVYAWYHPADLAVAA